MLAAGLLAPFAPSVADDNHSPDPLEQRTRFLAAKTALEKGDAKTFLKTAATLQDYPLYPYLIYWHLQENLDKQNNTTINAFLKRYDNLPLTPLLRADWLRHLAREERWQDYLEFYRGSNRAELRCYAHRAELATGDTKAAWAGAKKHWLVGYSQSDSCDPLFEAWEKAGGLTNELRWQRVERVMERGNSGLARYLAKSLDEKQKSHVQLWRSVHQKPELITSSVELKENNKVNRDIVHHGLLRMAGRDPGRAAALWPDLSKRYSFSQDQKHKFARKVAMNFAFDGDKRALDWFASLDKTSLDSSATGWAVRTALRQGMWKPALDWLKQLPDNKRHSNQWKYWEARIREAKGETGQATTLYKAVSKERSYYGFLAADRSEQPYNLSHEPLEVSNKAIAALKDKPALVRAHELYHLTLTREARREWDHAVANLNHDERLAAGKLADQWKWHDRALLTLARAKHWDDLDIRFPLAHYETVTAEAEKNGLDPAWVYAVARQESAFIEDVRSSAGAMGLMQVMPATGRTIARKLKTDFDNYALLEPETNIRFGSFYLQQVLDRFNSNPVLATAAYNAGPHRVESWTPQGDSLDADIFVDTMPFHETRQYVRRVMAYSVFYDQRLAQPIKRLSQRMPLVQPEKTTLAQAEANGN